jgi:methylmalonyl-CoA mutase N-terminal domain/subunit
LTAQEPENNIVRTALQALAAVLGGTQSLHTNALDEAYAVPTEQAARLALRTQQIIAEESGVTNTVDPLGGSYFVEALTNEMERGVYEYLERIDALGGVIPAIEQGYFQREIAESAYRYQREVEDGARRIVGVNSAQGEPEGIPVLRVDPESERRHLTRLARVRAERDSVAVGAALAALRRAAEGTENLMPYLLAAVRAYATLGEITDVLRGVFGEHKERVVV